MLLIRENLKPARVFPIPGGADTPQFRCLVVENSYVGYFVAFAARYFENVVHDKKYRCCLGINTEVVDVGYGLLVEVCTDISYGLVFLTTNCSAKINKGTISDYALCLPTRDWEWKQWMLKQKKGTSLLNSQTPRSLYSDWINYYWFTGCILLVNLHKTPEISGEGDQSIPPILFKEMLAS